PDGQGVIAPTKDGRRMSRTAAALGLVTLLLIGPATPAGEPADEAKGVAFFESKIRPVLAEHCYKCHSAAAGKTEAGLALDTRKGIRAGGDRGPAVVPGDPGASLLLTAI